MATLYDVPERYCPKGHRITQKQEIVEKRRDGSLVVTGLVNKSFLICDTCAWEAGGGEIYDGTRRRMKRGKALEKLGQESFLQTIPAKFIP